MRSLFLCLFIALLSFSLMINEASAKRFGGGRSFGVQRSHSSLFSPQRATHNTPGQRPNTNSSKWGGVLGGLLVGGLLASLFMGHGLASGLLSWLIVGGLIFFVVNLFLKKRQATMPPAQSSSFGNPFTNFNSAFTPSNNEQVPTTTDYPPGFVPEQFVREAKVCFMRLQAAFDQKNLQDLTAFTAPEVFGEIKMQLDERGEEPNKTEIIQLDAELLDVSKQFDSMIASVRFSGSVKENEDPVTTFDEIWHFRQFGNSKEWLVGGIQQDTTFH